MIKYCSHPDPEYRLRQGFVSVLIRHYAPEKSILGVCLGHQAIGEAFGGSAQQSEQVYHGLATPVSITDRSDPLFKGLPEMINAGRYHSWVVTRENLAGCFTITCEDERVSSWELVINNMMFVACSSILNRCLQNTGWILSETGFQLMSRNRLAILSIKRINA